MTKFSNADNVIKCSKCNKEVNENIKICPHCSEIFVALDNVTNMTDSKEKTDFFKKHNMVRKTLSMLKEEQRLEFQTALDFIENGAVKRGIFHLEKIMYEDGLKLSDENLPLVLGEVYLKYGMTAQCEKYINFINQKFPACRSKTEELMSKLKDDRDNIWNNEV